MLASQAARMAGFELESLLHHRADQASELGNLACEQLLSELEVAENALQRVRVPVIRRGLKKLACDLGPMLAAATARSSLLLKWWKKAPLVTSLAAHRSSTVVAA